MLDRSNGEIMFRLKKIAFVIVLAALLTLASVLVKGSAQVSYTDIAGCENSCRVAAAGFPFAFIADYPGISPTKSVSLIDALLGLDCVLVGQLAASFICWAVLVTVVLLVQRGFSGSRSAS
jgi:hypothetical protein